MPRLAKSVPAYRKHKASGQAVVTLNGCDLYLGPHGTKASLAEYDRLIGIWIAGGRQFPKGTSDLTLSELMAAYIRHVDTYYRKDGKPTSTVNRIRSALKPLRELFGGQLVRDFGPLALETIQKHLIPQEICRKSINARIGWIKRMFKWGVAKELVPSDVYQALTCVSGLRAGRTEAIETAPVQPVPDDIVEATLPHLPEIVADMVRFQRRSACRPGEVCQLRPMDVDTTVDPWIYRPASHKTQHHGRTREILLGSQAQDVLRKYLLRDKTAYCFTPAESAQKQRDHRTAARKTPLSCGNTVGSNRKRKARLQPGARYGKDAYYRAIRRGCDRADAAARKLAPDTPDDVRLVPRWNPNRLRHTAATEIRHRCGLEAAQVILGHAHANVTQMYAERNMALAIKAVREVG